MFSISVRAGNTVHGSFHTPLRDHPIGDADVRNAYVTCASAGAAMLVQERPAPGTVVGGQGGDTLMRQKTLFLCV